MLPDLFSGDHFKQKNTTRAAQSKPEDWEPWEIARERYVQTKIEPLLQVYRESDHDWFKDFSRRKGEVMHASDLIYRVQNLNPHIFIQQQYNYPDQWGMYTENLGRIQYLSGFDKFWLTEFSWALTDERNLPTEHQKGWSTVLVELVLKGALKWDDVYREFGDPQDGFNDERWQAATVDIRHGEDGISQRNIANSLE